MYWNEIRRSEHYEKYHKGELPWSEVVKLIYSIKNKKKNGDKIQIEDEKFYILGQVRSKTLFIINVKRKGG